MSLTNAIFKETTLAILAGGRSRRFGSNKGLFILANGLPLVSERIATLGPAFPNILVVLRSKQQAQEYTKVLEETLADGLSRRLKIICDEDLDDPPPSSAASGLLCALRCAGRKYILATTVDQAAVRPAHLQALVSACSERPDHDCIAFASPSHRIHPFPSLWRKSAEAKMDLQIRSGSLVIRRIQEALDANVIDPGEDGAAFDVNINTPADAAAALE